MTIGSLAFNIACPEGMLYYSCETSTDSFLRAKLRVYQRQFNDKQGCAAMAQCSFLKGHMFYTDYSVGSSTIWGNEGLSDFTIASFELSSLERQLLYDIRAERSGAAPTLSLQNAFIE